jgi:F0F1-type ATP synthase assembly protein I
MAPENEKTPVTMLAMKVLAQMGVMLVLIIGGSVLLGLLLDSVLGTKPAFIFILLLASIPVTLWVIYRYSVYQSKRIMSSQKEDNIP